VDSNQILNSLPKQVKEQVTITERKDHFRITHPYLDDNELFNQIQEAIEKLGGEYGGYYDKAAHYEIPKTSEGVTPHLVTMDKQGINSQATYKEAGVPEPNIIAVNIDALVQSPFWTREFSEDEEFQELVESIKNNGISQNLVARQNSVGALELVIGHRRWLAARKAGLSHVPVHIRKLSDEQVLFLQFDENERREDLTDMEKARFLQTMIVKLGYTQRKLAEKLGKSEAWVSLHLNMLELEKLYPGKVSTEVHPGEPIETGELTERQARELLKAPIEKREEILKEPKIPSAREIQRRVMPKVCEKCGVASSDVEDWNNHGINLCSQCREKAKKNPEHFLGLKQTKKTLEKIESTKPTDSWEFRKARMQPQHGKMEQALLLKLQEAQIRPVVTDRQFCLQTTTPDFYFPNKKLAVYLDGPVHKGREDRDEKLRGLLKKRQGVNVLSVPYTSMSKQETERIFTLIKEALQ